MEEEIEDGDEEADGDRQASPDEVPAWWEIGVVAPGVFVRFAKHWLSLEAC